MNINEENNIPYIVKDNEMTFLHFFNDSIDKIKISKKIKEIKFDFDSKFNNLIDNLPDHITKLELPKNFFQPINKLPSNLIELDLGNDFNHPINNLPSSIEKLKLSYEFNQSVQKLPANIKEISIKEIGNSRRILQDLIAYHGLKPIKIIV